MKKLVVLSSKEALLLESALSHFSYHCSHNLNSQNKDVVSLALDDLELCDSLRKKIRKSFPDLSNI